MWLIIQIAAGIVLAYVIIRNGAAVWRFSIGALIAAGIAIGVFALASVANEATAEYGGVIAVILDILKGVGLILAMVAYVACIFASGLAVSYVISHLTRGRWPKDKWALFFGFVTFALTGFALQGFTLATNGPIFKATDALGRAHGLADGLTMLLWVVVSLWPLAIAYLLKRRIKTGPTVTSQGTDAHQK